MAQVKNSQLLTKRSSLRSSDSGFSDKMRSLSKKITSSFRSKTFKDYIPEDKAEEIDKDFLAEIINDKTGSLTERVETERKKIEEELAELHTKLSAYRDLSTPKSKRALGKWLLKTKTKNISGEKTITEIFAKDEAITQWKTLTKQYATLETILQSEKERLTKYWLFSAFSYLFPSFKQQKSQETSKTNSAFNPFSETESQSPQTLKKRSTAYWLRSTIFRSLFSSRQQKLEEIDHSLSSFSNDSGEKEQYNPFDSENKSKVTQEQIEEGNNILTTPLKDIIRDITINDFSDLKDVSLKFNEESLLKKAVFNPFEEKDTAPDGSVFNPFEEENTALDADTIQGIIAASEAHNEAVETARAFTAKTDEEKRAKVETDLKAALQKNSQAITTLSEEMTQKIESYDEDIKKYTRLKNLLHLDQKLHKVKGVETVWEQEIKDIEQRIQEIQAIQTYTRQYLDTMKKVSLLAIINEDASRLLAINPFSSEEQQSEEKQIDTAIEKACEEKKNVFNPFTPQEEPQNTFEKTLRKDTVIETIKQGLKEKKFNIIDTLREESTTKLEELSRCRQLKTILEVDLQLEELKKSDNEQAFRKIAHRRNNITEIEERLKTLEPQETYHKTRLQHLEAIQTRDLFSNVGVLPGRQPLYSTNGMLDDTKVTEQIRNIEGESNRIGGILTQLAGRTGINNPLKLQKQVREAMQETYGKPLDEKIAKVNEELKDAKKLESKVTKKSLKNSKTLSRRKTQLLSKKVDLQQFTQPSGTSTSSEELRKKVIETWKKVLKTTQSTGKLPQRKVNPDFSYDKELRSCHNHIKQLNILKQMIEADRQLQAMPSAKEQLKSIRQLRKKLKLQYRILTTYRIIEEQVMEQPSQVKKVTRSLSRRFSMYTLSGRSTKSPQSKGKKEKTKKVTQPFFNF